MIVMSCRSYQKESRAFAGSSSMNPLIGLPQGTCGKEVVLELGICSGLLSGYISPQVTAVLGSTNQYRGIQTGV